MNRWNVLINTVKNFMTYVSLLLIIALVGFISSFFMGNDNSLEKAAENFIDQEIEGKLHLPDGSVNIDLTPDNN